MSHPVKPAPAARDSVEEILRSLAENLISGANDREPTVHETLSELSLLGDIASASIPNEPPATAPESAPASGVSTAKTASAARLPPVEVSPRYAGQALKDPSVLEALVRFHQSHAPVMGARSGPARPAPAPTHPGTAKSDTSDAPSTAPESFSGFAAAEIPVVEARPKASGSLRRTNTRPVLRS